MRAIDSPANCHDAVAVRAVRVAARRSDRIARFSQESVRIGSFASFRNQ